KGRPHCSIVERRRDGSQRDPHEREPMSDRVVIFDTTLRDGEQTAGIALNGDDKLEIAQQPAKLGVDVIEAGFAASSPGDFDAVARIAKTVKGPKIASL